MFRSAYSICYSMQYLQILMSALRGPITVTMCVITMWAPSHALVMLALPSLLTATPALVSHIHTMSDCHGLDSYLLVPVRTDINECSSPDLNNCQMLCNNTVGSYSCGCNTGYALNADQTTCSGITPHTVLLEHPHIAIPLLQMWMSVWLELTCVSKTVGTLLGPILAAVMLAISQMA